MSADKREIFAKSYAQKMQAGKSEPELSPTDKDLRGRQMSEDPMLEYFRDKERTAGFKRKQPPKYRGYYPPNRHNISPGYRWDGVDRSNGHEKKLLERESKRVAKEEADYRNETRDM